jgi:hypothetical protein
MSLTSYRAAPPRVKKNWAFWPLVYSGLFGPWFIGFGRCVSWQGRVKDAGGKTGQRLTLPCLKTKYHQRGKLSRPSSEWGRVGHLRHSHPVILPACFFLMQEDIHFGSGVVIVWDCLAGRAALCLCACPGQAGRGISTC